MSKKYRANLKQDSLVGKQVLEVIIDESNLNKGDSYPIEILKDYEGDDLVESCPNIVLEENRDKGILNEIENSSKVKEN